ncbi:ras GTPase-activating protein [Armillaria novae-zelandiae]|uniref:Ras GTPase-activating protein n=1 Tax=Armillaria novae-zelandiae TaxID=153914 RepID=A0AA39PUX3_9AGAR|nr:ras GTPase-activating protein [Armillaria novae-zelandiae]
MDRPNPVSSAPSRSGSSSGAFAYQTRLLERTSSTRSGASVSRNNSQSGMSILTNPTGSSATPNTRRWVPSHRVANSLDAVRGRWEERSRDAAMEDHTGSSSSPTRIVPNSQLSADTQRPSYIPSTPSHSSSLPDQQRTPPYLKRHTMPAPIIASPLSPNTTGVTVEADLLPSSATATHRIHLPSSPYASDKTRHTDQYLSSALSSVESSPSPSRHRATTLSGSNSPSLSLSDREVTASPPPVASSSNHDPFISTPSSTPLKKRPTSYYGGTSSPDKVTVGPSILDRTNSYKRSLEASTTTNPTSVMSPTPYRSSYMNNKKAATYGESLTAGRRLGKHLPRIASGDGDDHWEEKRDSPREWVEAKDVNLPINEVKAIETTPTRREMRVRDLDVGADSSSESKRREEMGLPVVDEGDGVAGIPGRLRLSRYRAPHAQTPMPSSRLARGLWADTQRHLIQAYEYLCHVGEAQQWIEGCLGEELGFGVVEMESGLRNGVVLAKLVKVFTQDVIVKRIYEAQKLSFLHSDNINYFFVFVRQVGLPEGFIFELTDLYEKKNLPKVIYCIHALSHLLARRGLAERIGNLLGRLQFSDDQLQKTQKGLKDAGVAMPNFGNVGRELAKEINEEPEVEVETEDERRDRLLLENENSIIKLQSQCRGYIARQAEAAQRDRMRLIEHYVAKLQARCRGQLLRQELFEQRSEQQNLEPWAVALQAFLRGTLFRREWHHHLHDIRSSSANVIKIQAHLRGVLQRRRMAGLVAALRTSRSSFVKLQSMARLRLVKRSINQVSKTFVEPSVATSVMAMQAFSRGAIARQRAMQQVKTLYNYEGTFIALQSQCRGILVRRQMRKQMAKLEDVTQTVVRVQAASRTYLARKRLLSLIRGLRKATASVVSFQTIARTKIVRQQHKAMTRALMTVSTVKAVGSLQALARASLARSKHQEVTRKLEFVAPDMVRFQAVARGVLARDDYFTWRDHLFASQDVATFLQALLRGAMVRRKFRSKMDYYRSNLSKVIQIQSLMRAKETREQYRQLTMGQNVTVGTIKNFVHLLDDSEADFQDEITVERLRKRVVQQIRENQALENDLNDLDTKIGLVVENMKTVKRRHTDNAAGHAARTSLLAAHGDPFSGPNTLDHTARRKLELYQQLFYLLQTRGEYLSHLFHHISQGNAAESNRRFVERVVLTLFGYGQDSREDYLLLKVFQLAIRDEFVLAKSPGDIIRGHPMYINIAVHYLRQKQAVYVREAFQDAIQKLVDHPDLDLEADPCTIYEERIRREEMRSEVPINKAKQVSFHEALRDPDTRAIYIRHIQMLQWATTVMVQAIMESTKKMPYSIRYLARETLNVAREMYPDASDEVYAACIGRLVFYRYINPAIVTPESFNIISTTLDVQSRSNLSEVSRVLTQITSGSPFGEDNPSYVPINDYVRKTIDEMTAWLLEVANVADAETQFHAHEFLDATVQPKPIYISPNEIYTMHGLLSQHQDSLGQSADDALKTILRELDGVPHFGNEELKDARDHVITLELTNRFADVKDPHAEEKALWVQAKRGVLAILRVQPAQDLVESLLQPVTDDDELIWEGILDAEIVNEEARHTHPGRQASQAVADSAYRLEDIRSLTFRAVKALAISYLLKLEERGKISRVDGFQGILNAIAGDVRSKHRKRIQRQQEMESMNEALRQLGERKKEFEERIDSYHRYAQSSMATMFFNNRRIKRFTLPFTKQYFHLRDLQKSGQNPKFGSYLYSAKDLYEKGILLSIDQHSPRQFDKIQLTMSSNAAGVFNLLLESTLIGGTTTKMGSDEIQMEDLLQAKYEQRSSLTLFNGHAKVNLDLFVRQINKK